MPTREEWIQVHEDLMMKLHLPCKLRFSTKIKIGCHTEEDWDIEGGAHVVECYIEVNPNVDFRVPAHLILHEAAHHRVIAPFFDTDHVPGSDLCHAGTLYSGHCEHWAQALCDMYRETGTALPQTTGFPEFAKLAGIVRKSYGVEE
jgi:hypothetical protein